MTSSNEDTSIYSPFDIAVCAIPATAIAMWIGYVLTENWLSFLVVVMIAIGISLSVYDAHTPELHTKWMAKRLDESQSRLRALHQKDFEEKLQVATAASDQKAAMDVNVSVQTNATTMMAENLYPVSVTPIVDAFKAFSKDYANHELVASHARSLLQKYSHTYSANHHPDMAWKHALAKPHIESWLDLMSKSIDAQTRIKLFLSQLRQHPQFTSQCMLKAANAQAKHSSRTAEAASSAATACWMDVLLKK